MGSGTFGCRATSICSAGARQHGVGALCPYCNICCASVRWLLKLTAPPEAGQAAWLAGVVEALSPALAAAVFQLLSWAIPLHSAK